MTAFLSDSNEEGWALASLSMYDEEFLKVLAGYLREKEEDSKIIEALENWEFDDLEFIKTRRGVSVKLLVKEPDAEV